MAVEPARAVAMDAARRASPESPRTVVARRLAATVFTGAEGLDLETLSARVSAICALVMEASWVQSGADIAAGLALMVVSLPRGPVRHSYGGWSRVVV